MKGRSTIDLVVILMTSMVGVVLLLSVVGVLILKITHPELDTSKAGEAVGGVVTTIVGALVGFIGGRAAGRLEANGGGTKE